MTKRRLLSVLLVCAFFIGVHFLCPSFRVPSVAMEPAIPAGSHVYTLRTTSIARGDVVVFRYPLDPRTTFAKRLIGLPGETVEIRDKHVFINGRELAEAYVLYADATIYPKSDVLPEPYRSRDQFGPFVVPANSYFMLGDNRDRSSDSRYWGPVPRENVRGVVYLGASWTRGLWRVR